jgi:2-keto-3-deoxy-L-rhamnonate aldolase RhmA
MRRAGRVTRFLLLGLSLASSLAGVATAQAGGESEFFNTVKVKLANGQQVVGGTVDTADPDIYCAMASAGFDFLWIEMQHSPLTYTDVARMIRICPGPAVPFIRVPDATEGDIQKATDIGAVGIIIPMVDSVQKVENAITFAKYPPLDKRSQGGGQYGTIWGRGYRQTANDNVMIVAMIENPAGVEIVEDIANIEHVDAVFAASSDLGSFSGLGQGDPGYEALVTRIKNATLAAGKYLGGPSAWKDTRDGYTFFQGPSATGLIRTGARQTLEGAPESGLPRGVAPIEGQENQ